MKIKKNWFETLYLALQSENLENEWENETIEYNETITQHHKIHNNNKYLHIVIYRDDKGLYERPISYIL